MNTFDLKGFEGLKDLPQLKDLEKFKEFKNFVPRDGQVWHWEGTPGDGMVFAFGNSRRIGVSTV